MPSKFFDVKSKAEFNNAFVTILNEVKETKTTPYLHIHCHGKETGLVLESGAEINWDILSKKVIPVNIACQNNLFLSMATCYGAFFVSEFALNILHKSKRAPLFGLLAPQKTISFDQVESNFTNYLISLVKSEDFDECLQLLRFQQGLYLFETCESIFDKFLRSYIKRIENETLEEHYRKTQNSIKYFMNKGLFPNLGDRIRISELLKDRSIIIDEFKKLHTNYFMIDLYPDSISRFRTVEQMLN